MSPQGKGRGLAIGLCLLFLISMIPSDIGLVKSPQNLVEDEDVIAPTTPIGQATTLTVGSWPDGANERINVAVGDGYAIKSMELELQPNTLQNSLASAMTDVGDFDDNAVYDGMDVNKSSLQILPQDWSYDFESGVFAPEWSLSGTSNWAIRADTRLQGAQLAKAGTITHNQESSMTLDVSQLPAASGTFRYSVSSEGSFDYLIFCIDNTGCTRYSGYTYRWSGTVNNGLQTFSIPATAQTLTWKYTKDGSVNSGSDTAWVDDIIITPSGGSGNGEGNWTSDVFGPSQIGRGEGLMHGLLHMDAYVYPGSIFEWQILDAQTSLPVPGFEHMTSTFADLGMIDAVAHPLLRLKFHMKEASGGGTPEVRSISMNGHMAKTFDTDPTSEGWQIQSGSWANGAITSSGVVLSNEYHVRSGFSSIIANNVQSGQGQLEFTTDGGDTWNALNPQGRQDLSAPAFMVQFRMQSMGGSYTWLSFDAELVRTSVPDGLRLDVGLDGTPEWSLDRDGIGILGLQNELITGDLWATKTASPSAAASFEMALPTRGVDSFSFAVASPSIELSSPYMVVSVNGQDVLNRGLSNIVDLVVVTLTSTELTDLNSALTQANGVYGLDALPMASVEVRIGSSLTTSSLLFGGVFAPYESNMTLTLNAAHPLVMGLNHELSITIPQAGQRHANLPVRMDGTGSIFLTITSIETQASVRPVSLEVSNVTNTLVPGNDWIETKAIFDFTPLGITDAYTHAQQSNWEVQFQLVGQSQQSTLRCPVASLPITPLSISSCTASGTALVWFDEGLSGSITAIGSSSYLEFGHHFKFPDGWNDEPSAIMMVNMLAPTGSMLPVSQTFGLGYDQGVENDIALRSWSVLSSEGIRSDAAFPYLRAGELVNIEVVLGFEGTDEGTPRTGAALVRFLVDGAEYATTSSYSNGVALFPYNVPSGRPSMELGVEVVPLRGQDMVEEVANTHTFLFDNVPPTLVSSDVERFDNRDASPRTELKFSIADRPHLPTHAMAMIWRSWVDDANGDLNMSSDELQTMDLTLPQNLSTLIGEYSLLLDTADAEVGDYFVGWLEVGDSAGHRMADSGDMSTPLFNVQINEDGAPSLGASTLAWPNGEEEPWIHPDEWNTIQIPIWERNGIYDLSEIHLALAFNTPYPSVISWNQSTDQCSSSHAYIELESCELLPLEENDLFSRNGVFEVNFSIEWGYDPDTSLRRIPHITMLDQSGQSNRFLLEPLSWKFSGEMMIDPDSLSISLGDEPEDSLGYWVKPRTSFDVTGSLVWYRSQRAVQQDLYVDLSLGENGAQIQSVNGTFTTTLMSPLLDGTYGLFGDLYDAPNGAVYRGDGSAFIWFIVDNEAPRMAAVDRPQFNTVLSEEEWTDLNFELRLNENARLDEGTLMLHWSLNDAGLGLNSYLYDNGSVPLEVLGERLSGESIPVRCTLNLDELMLPLFRTKAIELRVWVTGADAAGHEVDSVFNDIDAPLRVWTLEQRVPIYSIGEIEMKPSSELHQGDLITVATSISNNGLADGEANVVLELVESNGARTRLDARVINVQSGEQVLYQYLWKPGRDGTQWLELSIINGPNAQSDTVLVDEPRSDGVFATITSINTSLLVVVVLLSLGLVGLLVVGLRRETLPGAPAKPVPKVAQPKPPSSPSQEEEQGPYGSQKATASPGENPYQ